MNQDGSLRVYGNNQVSPGRYDSKAIRTMKNEPEGSPYDEMVHAGVMVSMWGDPKSDTELSPAALWNQMY